MKDQALYLEADEDITSAIDKLAKTPGDAVQIVVPKRSTLLQSIINLKLLKKAAADQHKQLVLVTTDKVATDLAARIGLAVAPSLGAKSVMAEAAPAPYAAAEEIIEDDESAAEAAKPEPAPKPPKEPTAFFKRSTVKPEPVPTPTPEAAAEAITEAAPVAAARSIPRPKVPNFNLLQRRLLWVGLAVVLIIGVFAYVTFFSRATVTLFAAGTKVSVDTNFTVDPNQSTSNATSGVLSGQTVTFNKDLTSQFTPTGQMDQGTKSHGTVSLKNCEDSNTYPLAAGNTLTSQGLSFVTDSAVTIPAGSFTHGGATCTSPTVSVPVTAAQNGDKYNLTNASFASAKLTPNFIIAGSMSGGTSKIVTVVSQADVDKAQAAAIASDKDASQKSLDAVVPSGYVALSGSTNVAPSNVVASPAVGQPGSSASVTLHLTYTELAVKKTDYEAFISARELTQVGQNNQIYDNGLGSADLSVTGKDSSGRTQFHLSTNAYSGAKIDQAALARSLAGKKYGDASDIAGRQPGVQHVTISLHPSWITSLPHSAAKIKIVIQVASSS